MIQRPARVGTRSVNLNGSTSEIDFGSNDSAFSTSAAQSFLALIRPTALGENSFGYVLSRLASAALDGMRFYIGGGVSTITVSLGFGSAGNSSYPRRTSNTLPISYGNWSWVAGTWDGSLSATGIRLYSSKIGERLAEPGYGTTTSGSGALRTGFGNPLIIGNRNGSDRTFLGDIAMVAWWGAELEPYELESARHYGPMLVRGNKLKLLWADGQEQIGHAHSDTAIGAGQIVRHTLRSASKPIWVTAGWSAGAADLVLQSAAHGHEAAALALTQAHLLVVSGADHGQSVAALTLSQVHALLVSDAQHGNAVESFALSQTHLVALADIVHAHTAEQVTLAAGLSLVLADLEHLHAAAGLTLTQTHILIVGDAGHAHAADSIALSGGGTLLVADAQHQHAADQITLSSAYQLAIADAVHALLANSPDIGQVHQLIVSETLHAHFAAQVAFGNVLTTSDSRVLIVPAQNRILIVARPERNLH